MTWTCGHTRFIVITSQIYEENDDSTQMDNEGWNNGWLM